MRFLALVDMLGIFDCGILFGIQMIQGAVFCSHKVFILITCLSGYGISFNTFYGEILFVSGMERLLSKLSILSCKSHFGAHRK